MAPHVRSRAIFPTIVEGDALMTINRRQVSKALLGAGMLSASPWLFAQTAFPSKPIRIIVPTPPGGNLDFMARVIAEKLTTIAGQPVLVENRTGASSSIGTRFVGQSAPDGHTLLIVGNTFASTPAIMPTAGYDAVKDFVGVTQVARLPNVIVVPSNSKYKTLQELVAAAKSKPEAVSYASAGSGSVSRFASERFAYQIGAKFVHVPFKGNGDALIDLQAGRVDYMFDQITTSVPHVKGGRLRALGITSATRSEALPDVPTFAEAGVPNFEDYVWIGLLAPAATPKDIVGRLNAMVVQAVQMPDVKSRFMASGADVLGTSSDAFTAYVRTEVPRLTKLAQDAKISLD